MQTVEWRGVRMIKINLPSPLSKVILQGRVVQGAVEPFFQRINGGLRSANLENMVLPLSLEFEIKCWGAGVSFVLLFAANPFSSAKWNSIQFQPYFEISDRAFGGLLEV